jgi:hypothetical protein
LLLVGVRSWGQAVPDPLEQVLRHYAPTPAAEQVANVAVGYRGTLQLPPNATQRRTGTKDSDQGEVRLDQLLIGYDIGKMAGAHISPYNRSGSRSPGGNPAPFSAYEERAVGLLQVTLGLRPGPGGTEVVATLRARDPAAYRSSDAFPANFWAPVHSEAELRQFLAVVFSYRPGVSP